MKLQQLINYTQDTKRSPFGIFCYTTADKVNIKMTKNIKGINPKYARLPHHLMVWCEGYIDNICNLLDLPNDLTSLPELKMITQDGFVVKVYIRYKSGIIMNIIFWINHTGTLTTWKDVKEYYGLSDNLQESNIAPDSGDITVEDKLNRARSVAQLQLKQISAISKRMDEIARKEGTVSSEPHSFSDDYDKHVEIAVFRWFSFDNPIILSKVKKLEKLRTDITNRLEKYKKSIKKLNKQQSLEFEKNKQKSLPPEEEIEKMTKSAPFNFIISRPKRINGRTIRQGKRISNPYYTKGGWAGHPLRCPFLSSKAKHEYLQLEQILLRNNLPGIKIMYAQKMETVDGSVAMGDYIMVSNDVEYKKVILQRSAKHRNQFNKIWMGGSAITTSHFLSLDTAHQDRILKQRLS